MRGFIRFLLITPAALALPTDVKLEDTIELGQSALDRRVNTGAGGFNYTAARLENAKHCLIYDPPNHDASTQSCYNYCKPQVDAAKAAGRTTNYGCLGFFPNTKDIPWQTISGIGKVAGGNCICDNPLVNELADMFIKAMPIIAQVRKTLGDD
jgi:hypothetical protein